MPPALPHTRSQQPRQSWRTRNRSRQAHDRSTDRRKDARACRRHSEGPTHRRRPSPPETLEVPRYMPSRRRNRASGRARPRSNARPRFRIRIRRAPRNLPPLRCRPLRLRRYHQSRTPKAPARRAPESEPPRTKSACTWRETKLQLCLRGLQSTLQTPPLMKPEHNHFHRKEEWLKQESPRGPLGMPGHDHTSDFGLPDFTRAEAWDCSCLLVG